MVSARHARSLIFVSGMAVAAFLFGAVPSLASAESVHGKITSAATARKAAKHDPDRGTLSVAARRAIHRGYLVPNQGGYDRQKARLTRRAARREALTAPAGGPLAPSIVSGRSFQSVSMKSRKARSSRIRWSSAGE